MDRVTAQSRACCGDKWLDTLLKHIRSLSGIQYRAIGIQNGVTLGKVDFATPTVCFNKVCGVRIVVIP